MSQFKPELCETDAFFQLPEEARKALGKYARQHRGWAWVEGRWEDSLESQSTDTQAFLPIDITAVLHAMKIRSQRAGLRVLNCEVAFVSPYTASVLIDMQQPFCIAGPTPRYTALSLLGAVYHLIASGEWLENTEFLGKAIPKETLKP